MKTGLKFMIAALMAGQLLSVTALADSSTEVRQYPGFNGSGTNSRDYLSGEDWFDEGFDDDDDDEPYVTVQRGWRYSPGGWYFQYSDGTWPSDEWKYISGRWYRFDQGGHMLTGWYTAADGNKYFLNPYDDGTLGAMRIGWQLIDGKLYYFNTNSDGYLGKMMKDMTTPDGYRIGPDGVWIP